MAKKTLYRLPLKQYPDFRGGWNADSAPDTIADNEMTVADDLDLGVRGGIKRRLPYLRLNTASYGVVVKQTIEYNKNNGTNQILSLVGANLSLMNQTDWTVTSVIKAMTRDTVPHYFYGDKMFYLDGAEYNVYDGTTSRLVQIAAPATKPTVAGSGVGTFNGVYKCYVTFVQADGYESNPSPVESVTATNDLQLDWSAILTGPTGTVSRRLYRSISGGTIAKRLATIADNTTTTYTDTTADGDLSAVEMITDNNLTPLKSCDVMVYHAKSGRIFAINWDSAEVLYSEAHMPDYFRSSVVPTSGDGPAVALYLISDAVIVQYGNTAWAWRGQDPSQDAIWQELPMPGAFSNGAVIRTPGTITWLGPGGFYGTDPGILSLAGQKIETENSKIVNFAANKIQTVIANMGTKSAVSAVYDSNLNRAYFAVPMGTLATANNYIIVLDWSLKAFTRYTNINAVHLMRRRNGDVLASTNGYIVKINGGTLKDPGDIPVSLRFKSKPYHVGYPFHKKRFLRLYTEFKAPSTGEIVVSFNIYVDSILVYTRDHVSTDASFIWGESSWGEAVWGQRELVTTRSKVSKSGHRVEVEIIDNQTDIDDVEIYSFAFEFRSIRAKGDRV